MPFDPVQRTRDFLETITPSSKIALLHDDDPDGTCSGVLATRLLKRSTGKELSHRQVAPHEPFLMGITPTLAARGITHVIICDLSIDRNPDKIKEAEKHFHILSFDHHKLLNDVNSGRTFLIKPHLFWNGKDPSKYCTSKLAYDVGNHITDLSDGDWLALTGSICDIATEPWKDWMQSVFSKYHELLPTDLFTSLFGKVGLTISDALAYETTFDERVFQTVLAAHTPADVIQSPLKQYHDAIQNEINKWIALFKEKADHFPQAHLKSLELNTPYHIRSTLNTILSFTHDKLNTILLYQRRDNVVNFSTRNQSGTVPLNDVLREAIADLPDSEGGGHPKAAGGHCNAKDWPIVKQRITDQLRAYAKKNAQ